MFIIIAMAQLVKKRMPTPGSIPEITIRCCVLGKDTLRILFPIGIKQSTRFVIAQPEERLASRTPKGVRTNYHRILNAVNFRTKYCKKHHCTCIGIGICIGITSENLNN